MTIGLGCEFWKESYPCESSNIQKAKGNLNDSSGGKDDHEGKVKDDPSGDKDDQIIRTLKGKSCSWEIFNASEGKDDQGVKIKNDPSGDKDDQGRKSWTFTFGVP